MSDPAQNTTTSVPLAAVQAIIEVLLSYVSPGQQEAARAASLAVGIGYAFPKSADR